MGSALSLGGSAPRTLFLTAFTIGFLRFEVHFSCSVWVLRRDSSSAHVWSGLRNNLIYILKINQQIWRKAVCNPNPGPSAFLGPTERKWRGGRAEERGPKGSTERQEFGLSGKNLNARKKKMCLHISEFGALYFSGKSNSGFLAQPHSRQKRRKRRGTLHAFGARATPANRG